MQAGRFDADSRIPLIETKIRTEQFSGVGGEGGEARGLPFVIRVARGAIRSSFNSPKLFPQPRGKKAPAKSGRLEKFQTLDIFLFLDTCACVREGGCYFTRLLSFFVVIYLRVTFF